MDTAADPAGHAAVPATAAAAERLAALLADPQRLCPMLAWPAWVQDGRMIVRDLEREHCIDAPPGYLAALFAWCDGERDWATIEREAAARADLGAAFCTFLRDLLSAEVIIDASTYLARAAASARTPLRLGRAVARDDWTLLHRRLPERLPAGASPLPGADAPLLDTLRRRQSAGAFGTDAITAEALSTLLMALYGAVAPQHPQNPARELRAVPSGGALYRLDVHLVLLRDVDAHAPGVYRVVYTSGGGVGLAAVGGDPAGLVRALLQPGQMRRAAGLVALSADLLPVALKYRNRSQPLAWLEAGAALQNAALAAAQLGLAWRPLAAFDDARLSALLQLTPGRLLITALFGSRPADAIACERVQPVEFAWLEVLDGASFHLASARLADRRRGVQAWGRDADPAHAYHKALGEAVERAACRTPPAQLVHARADELPAVLDPGTLVRYSPTQRARADFPFAPYRPADRYAWVPAQRFDDGLTAWVPAEFVLHPLALPPAVRPRPLFRATSSGCASHGRVEAALERAVHELIERDAFMRHWLLQRPGRRVPARAWPVALGASAERLRAQGCRVEVLRLDASVLPVWLVAIRSNAPAFMAVGAATGCDPEAALQGAYTEAETAALARLGGVPSRTLTPKEVRTPRDHADLYAQARYCHRADFLIGGPAVSSWQDAVHGWPATFDATAHTLQRRGLAIWWVDLSLPDAPMTLTSQRVRTVRALVPGLIPITFGRGTMPLGMLDGLAPRGCFPHPFP